MSAYLDPQFGAPLSLQRPLPRPEATDRQPGGARILIVEDDAQLAALFALQLSAVGYRTVIAGDAAQAGAAVQQSRFDLVLMDIVLPGDRDGIQIAAAIGQEFDLPLIVLSALDPDGLQTRLLDSGAYGFLLKPVNEQLLLVSVALALKHHRAETRVRQSEALYRTLTDSAPDGMLLADETGRLIQANRSAEAMFGYAPGGMVGLAIEALVPDDVRDAHRAHRSAYDRQPWHGAMRSAEIRACRLDGSSFPAEISLGHLKTADGLLVTSTVRDVSERVRQTRALRRLNQTLKLIHDGNGALVRAVCENEIIGEIARLLHQDGGYPGVWIELTDPTEALCTEPATIASEPGLFDPADAATPWRAAYRADLSLPALASGRPAVRVFERPAATGDNLAAEEWTKHLAASGLHAAMALPLIGHGEPIGVMNLLARDADGFDPAGQELLQEFADDLAYGIVALRDRTERQRFAQTLAHQANHDTPTGLPNRHLLGDRLAQAIAQAARREATLAVLLIDLDQFKRINDAVGHQGGDELLRLVAERLADTVRAGDTVARWSGDEFVVLLVEPVDEDAAARLMRRIADALAEPVVTNGQELRLTCSIGASLYPRDGDDAESLLRNADSAMHRAKSAGRDGFQFYQRDMNARATEQMALEADLRRAIERRELVLHYQPQVDLVSCQMIGMEALLRWNHPQRGLVPPSDFIPLCEEAGLIVPVGQWVIEESCRQVAAWQAVGLVVPRMAINLSARQFRDGGLAASIAAALADNGLAGSALEVELTESLALEDIEQVSRTLKQLRAHGVSAAIDDFGTGFSSLSALLRFKIDKIKIDQSFVRDIMADPNAAAVTLAVIAMARSLGIKTIAEGVETEAQLGFLRQRGCDEIQGYYFSRPLPAADLASLLSIGQTLSADSDHSEASKTVLLVDDEPNVANALRRVLRPDHYRILVATSGQEGLELLARHRVAVIVSDQRMPGMPGTEFLSRAKELFPDTVRIILSGYTDLQSVTDAINRGAIYKFLTKPWDDAEFRETVRDAFRRYRPGESAK
jgi:diguanylate cyclase (GGDEF)-like protein/PAS domain S-box-containing protein